MTIIYQIETHYGTPGSSGTHFSRAATIAIRNGIQALDEISVRCFGKTNGKTYMPNNPIKYGIIFYAVVGHSSRFLHSIYGNNSGNKTLISHLVSYCSLHGVLMRKIDQKPVERDSFFGTMVSSNWSRKPTQPMRYGIPVRYRQFLYSTATFYCKPK